MKVLFALLKVLNDKALKFKQQKIDNLIALEMKVKKEQDELAQVKKLLEKTL